MDDDKFDDLYELFTDLLREGPSEEKAKILLKVMKDNDITDSQAEIVKRTLIYFGLDPELQEQV